MRQFLAAIPLICSLAAYGGQPAQSISLTLLTSNSNEYLAEVQLSVDGRLRSFLLDTGAASSSLASDTFTNQYPSIESSESTGISGKAAPCQLVRVGKLQMGHYAFRKTSIKRCERNILGIDLLGEQIFEVDLPRRQLNLLQRLPQQAAAFPLQRLKPGHIAIPVMLGASSFNALFDTGAEATVLDLQFIKAHPDQCTRLRSDNGFDAHGNEVSSDTYRCQDFQVGPLHLKEIEVAGFDFGAFMRDKMEGSPMILGNNVISQARWAFDMGARKWTATKP